MDVDISKLKVVAHNFITFMGDQILKLRNLDHAQKLKKAWDINVGDDIQ